MNELSETAALARCWSTSQRDTPLTSNKVMDTLNKLTWLMLSSLWQISLQSLHTVFWHNCDFMKHRLQPHLMHYDAKLQTIYLLHAYCTRMSSYHDLWWSDCKGTDTYVLYKHYYWYESGSCRRLAWHEFHMYYMSRGCVCMLAARAYCTAERLFWLSPPFILIDACLSVQQWPGPGPCCCCLM